MLYNFLSVGLITQITTALLNHVVHQDTMTNSAALSRFPTELHIEILSHLHEWETCLPGPHMPSPHGSISQVPSLKHRLMRLYSVPSVQILRAATNYIHASTACASAVSRISALSIRRGPRDMQAGINIGASVRSALPCMSQRDIGQSKKRLLDECANASLKNPPPMSQYPYRYLSRAPFLSRLLPGNYIESTVTMGISFSQTNSPNSPPGLRAAQHPSSAPPANRAPLRDHIKGIQEFEAM